MMTMDSRAALRAAQGNLVAAEAALQAARATTERARAMLTQVVRDGEGLDVRMRQASEALADKIKGQIASGASPTFASGDMAKAAGARAELDARRAAAERVVAEFATAEHEAEFGVEMAREAVASAVREVIKAEAEKLAESWEAVELKARSLRIRLGGDGDPISRLPGFSEKIGRAIFQNRMDDQFRQPESEIAREPWADFADALQRDPDTQIYFSDADRRLEEARKERLERRAADERFLERLRAPAEMNS